MLPPSTAPAPRRRLVWFLLLPILVSTLSLYYSTGIVWSGSPSGPIAPAQSELQTNVRLINLQTNQIVFNQQTQKIYASLPSSAGSTGNSITEVDPVTAAVAQSVFIGSEPNKLALSEDGQLLYAALDGAGAIRVYDVPTQTPGQQFYIGSAPFLGPYAVGDLAVAPSNPHLLAVSRITPSVSPPGRGVAIFDNGVQRPMTSPEHTASSDFLAFSASASTLYGSSSFGGGLHTLTVDESGVALTSTSTFNVGGDIQFENGIIYSSTGRVVNPSTDTLLGTFSGTGSGPFVVDSSAGRAYYLIGGSSGSLNQTVTLRAYDINTFVPVGEISIAGVNGIATDLLRWGSNGFAFRTHLNQLFLIQTSLIPSPDPVPSPTPTPEVTPTPTPTPFELSVRQVQLSTKDIIYDSSTQNIYASVPSSAGSQGNSITSINPQAGSIGMSFFMGSEPNKLAISDDNQFLYVALNGAAAVRRFDLASQTPGLQFSLGAAGIFDGVFNANDIAVMPGNPQTVAVARTASSATSIAIYDEGVRRSNTSNGAGTDIEFSDSPLRLYSSFNCCGNGIAKHVVDDSGVMAQDGAQIGTGGKLTFADGFIYTANGSVIDPEPGVLKGTFNGEGLRFNSIMTVDATLGRAYFLTIQSGLNGLLRVYDINTFLLIGQVTFTVASNQHPDGFQFSSLVRWGENGLAFRTTTHLMFIQSTLINPNGAVPAPTPTPSPTPSPSPTPQPATFVRQVELPINDVVYQQQTQTIYASVASSAGSRGNTITPINPETGALGESVFIGSEPTRLGLSDNGQVLYAELRGAGAIRRFDIPSQTAGLQFTIAQSGSTYLASDIAVAPENSDLIAVARHSGGSPPEGGVAVFDNGVMRPTTTPGHSVASSFLAFSETASTLYGGGFDSGLNTMTLDSSGVSVSSTSPFKVGPHIEYQNGLIYSSRGQVVNPETEQLVGTFTGIPAFSSIMTVDTALGRIFFASGSFGNVVIRAYDIDTLLPLGTATLPINGIPTRIVRWGANGLAIRILTDAPNQGKLVLVQSELVSTAAPIPTGVQFATSSAGPVFEPSGSVQVQVIRTGDISGPSSVAYATHDGTASERSDYITALGTLHFAPGETSKTITVLITNDVWQEPLETFELTLSNPSACVLVSPETFVVTIQDDDFSPPSSNPIDTAQFFVRQHYRDFLNRDPDFSGLNFWTNEINSCGADAQCREIKMINVSAAFYLSIEFQESGYLAYRVYKTAYGDTTSPNVNIPVPSMRLREFLADTQQIGQGVRVGIGDWQTQLENNKKAYVREFVLRERFQSAFPMTLSPAQFIDALNQNAGGVLSQSERDQLVAELTAATDITDGRANALRRVAEDMDLRQVENNRAFVLMQYYGYLRRNPDDPQDADFRGWEFWVNKLNQFNGNFVDAEMVKSFLVSSEYRQRFGP